MNKAHFILFVFCILQVACVKDKPNPETFSIPSATHDQVLVCDEGVYGNNNAELSVLDLDLNKCYHQLFYTANQKSLGDIAQQISFINLNYYITLNASNRIVAINPNTFKTQFKLTNIQSPRYLVQVSTKKAYCSSLYFPSVYVIDLNSFQIQKTITTDFPNTEHMFVLNGYCYVTNWDTASSFLYKINIQNDSIEAKINIQGRASHDIEVDKNGMLWVLSGNKFKGKSSTLTQVNPNTNQVIRSMNFNSDEDPFRLTTSTLKDTLYFINVNYNGTSSNNGLYKMGIQETQLPTSPCIVANSNSYFYAVGIDPSNQHIFLSDPKGFTQQSTIYEYSQAGILLNQFTGGIGSNSFLFRN